MSLQLSSKLPLVGTTIFTVMNQVAAQHSAVNLGQGFPDYMMSEELTSLVYEAMNAGMNQYVHMNGLPLLRERISQKIAGLYGTNINPDSQVTITPGGTYAIYTALTTVLHPGDEVIIFEPAYDSYIPNVLINGATPVLISLQYPDYSIPWGEVRSKITSKTKMIMINSPHNPTGSVLSEKDIAELINIVADTNILILSDEVYEHLIFDDIPHLSILRYPELLERSFVCFSFGKTYNCTGWKLGYCISSSELMAEYRKVHQFNAFTCHTPSQVALAEYLTNHDAYLSLSRFMQQKRDYFTSLMAATPFKALPSHGSYFQCYSYEGLSDLPDTDFAIFLAKEYKIASIPVSAFYQNREDNRVLRFCFSKKQATLEIAVEKLIHYQPQ